MAVVLAGALLAPAPFAPEYVALGDSYAAGTGAGSYESQSCRRSKVAYPALYAAKLQFPSFRSAACTGATTHKVIAKQVKSLTPGTTLVTITVGGNDLGFVDVMTTCVLSGDNSCVKRVARAETFIRTELPARLDKTYAAVKQHAPAAKLVVLGYPRLFEPGDCRTLTTRKRTALNAAADTLAEVTRQRAEAAGATFVDVRAAFSGHAVCAKEPWINALVSPTGDSYHPNHAGQKHGYLRALMDGSV